MRLSEIENEDAIELLADIIEPTAKIFSDPETMALFKSKTLTRFQIGTKVVKKHKKEVIEIMARMDGIEPSKAHYNPVTLIKNLLDIINDKELIDFFQSQLTEETSDAFGNAMENTEVKEK